METRYPKTIVIGRSLYEVRSALEEEALRRTVVNHAIVARPLSIEDTQPPDPPQERER